MKNTIILCVLVSALVIGQSCAPKSVKATIELTAAEPNVATTKLVKPKIADGIAATQAKIAKASAEKEAQRKLAITDKAKATPIYKDASVKKIVNYKADVDPSFTGGFDELRQNLKNNPTYPEAAPKKGNDRTVFVDFSVDEKGRR